MRKLIQGVRRFQTGVFAQQRELFEALSKKQQNPRALFVTCSDSRVNPNLITQSEPGELFLLRNAGNIIPSYGSGNGSEAATIEYAISVLKMRNIIVCGHYGCGAMHYLMRQDRMGDLPSVRAWFAHAEATRRIVNQKYQHLTAEAREMLAIEQNVLVQIDNLRTHPTVAVAAARGDVNIYGWVYRIETGDVLAYDPASARFVPLSEEREPIAVVMFPQLCYPAVC